MEHPESKSTGGLHHSSVSPCRNDDTSEWRGIRFTASQAREDKVGSVGFLLGQGLGSFDLTEG